MRSSPNLKDHEFRITKLEGRVHEVETGHGDTIYKMHRRLAKLEIALFKHLKLPLVTDEEVDELLDQE